MQISQLNSLTSSTTSSMALAVVRKCLSKRQRKIRPGKTSRNSDFHVPQLCLSITALRSRLIWSKLFKVPGDLKFPCDYARIILSSEWARLDVTSQRFFDEAYNGSASGSIHLYSFEKAPIVNYRESCFMERVVLWVDREGHVTTACTGKTVSFPCRKLPEIPYQASWVPKSWSLIESSSRNTPCVRVRGRVRPT